MKDALIHTDNYWCMFTKEKLIEKAREQISFCRNTKITGEGRAHVNQCSALFEIALAALTAETKVWEIEDPGEGHYHIEHSPTGYRSELVRAEYILKIEPCPRCGNTSGRPDGAHYCHVSAKGE